MIEVPSFVTGPSPDSVYSTLPQTTLKTVLGSGEDTWFHRFGVMRMSMMPGLDGRTPPKKKIRGVTMFWPACGTRKGWKSIASLWKPRIEFVSPHPSAGGWLPRNMLSLYR